MAWVANPYALARMLLGEPPKARRWSEVEELLGDAFGSKGNAVLYGTDATPGILDSIAQIAASVKGRQPLSRLVDAPPVRALARRMGNGPNLARLLPFVAPVSDAAFGPQSSTAPVGALSTTHALRLAIGGYSTIGPLSVNGVSWLDPEQGCTGDCYLIAAMIAIAWSRPRQWFARLDQAAGGESAAQELQVAFHGRSRRVDELQRFSIPPRVPLDPNRHLIYAHSAVTTEMWPALLERAFVMQLCHCAGRENPEPTVVDYFEAGSSRAVYPETAARMLVGGTPRYKAALPGDDEGLFAALERLCDDGVTRFPTMAWTWPRDRSLTRHRWAKSGLLWEHCYAVLGSMRRRAGDFAILVDPYGAHRQVREYARGAWKEGAARNVGEAVALGHHGVFGLPKQAFDRFFHRLSWVEVPPDDALQ